MSLPEKVRQRNDYDNIETVSRFESSFNFQLSLIVVICLVAINQIWLFFLRLNCIFIINYNNNVGKGVRNGSIFSDEDENDGDHQVNPF